MNIPDLKSKIVDWFANRKIEPIDFLQDHGLVSDNAITLDEVADTDIGVVHYLIFSGEMEKLRKSNL